MTQTKTHWKQMVNYDYIGAYSLQPGQDIVLTIREVKNEMVIGSDGKKEKCIVIYWKEQEKPFVCNKTNAKMIAKIYGTPFKEEWVGKRIQLTAAKIKAWGEDWEVLRVVAKANPKAVPTLDKVENCEDCKQEIKPFGGKTAQQIGVYTNRKYGKTVCADCATRLNELEVATDVKAQEILDDILKGEDTNE